MTAHDNNPQREQMSDESMLRNLAAQADAIWPQERALIDGYALPPNARILDLACGPGELSERLLDAVPGAALVGIDLDAAHLAIARDRCRRFGDRARFEVGDAVELSAETGLFDLVVCRHLLQAVPGPERVLANMVGAARSGGRLHVVAEDYGMMHFWPVAHDIDEFWREGPVKYAAAVGTDLVSGRKIHALMCQLGVRDVRVEFAVIDTTRVPRSTFASIWTAWRDGYTDVIAAHTAFDRAHVAACFEDMIACIRNPAGYAVWQLPVITGVVA